MKFSKALRHIDIEDVKRKHLEEVSVKKLKEERLKEQDEQIKAEYEKWKSNWRAIGFDLKPKSVSENKKTKRKSFKKIMKEAMRTSSIMQQTETETVEVSDIDLTNPVSYANSITSSEEGGFVSTTGSSFNQGAGVFENGSGTPNEGFNLGSNYLGFAFPPNQSSPSFGRAEFGAQDLTNVDTISAFGIRGNITNGGSTPLVGGGVTEPGLRLQYKLSGMGTYVDFNVKPDGSIDNNVENILIPGGIATDSFTAGKNIVINIPSYIRTAQTEIRLITKDIGFHGTPVYGVKNFKFQRRTPQNVFVALDDPEAMSFIRIGQQPSVKRKSAKEREKDVVNLLKGGRDYTNKILGMQFPGSNPELSFSTDLPDQDIADIQQQQRSQTFNQIKDRFASDPGIDGRIQTLRATQSPTSQISYQDYEKFERYASVMPSYETSVVNVNQSFDDFANQYGQKLTGGNDELFNDYNSKFTPVPRSKFNKELNAYQLTRNPWVDAKKPVVKLEGMPPVYPDIGSIEDLLKSPHEEGYKKTFVTPNGERYTLARRVKDENGESIIAPQEKAIREAEKKATEEYNKARKDFVYKMGVEYYKQSVELQIKNFEKLTPRQQARRTRPRYNEAQARARGKNFQVPNYNPEKLTATNSDGSPNLLYEYHKKFNYKVYSDMLKPFRDAQKALNNKIVRIDHSKKGSRFFKLFPFKTGAEREKEVDDLFKELETGESGESGESGSDLGYKSADDILADVGDQWTYDEYIDMMNKITIQYSDQAEPLEKARRDYIKNNKDVPISIVDAIDKIVQSQTDAYSALDDAWKRYNKVPDLPPVSGEGEGEGEETKPQGLSRVLAGIADIATGQKFDFDKRGKELINTELSKTIKDKGSNIGTAARLYKDYLGNKTDSGFVADNQYLGNEYINNTFLPNATFYNDVTHVGDNVVGNGQGSTYNPKTNKIKTTATFNFKKNAQEIEGQYLTKHQQGFVKAIDNIPGLGYTLDSVPALTGTSLDTMGGMFFSVVTSVAKQSGGGKTVPIEIEYSPTQLYNKNKKGYEQLVDLGVIPDTKKIKYGDLYDSPFYKKKKVNESSTYNRIKNKFFNQKDIKPTFPENPPPEMVNGLHPEYGKRANRYKKLDPISANSMPLTGDPETDAVVKKQKTFKKFKRNIK